MPQKKPLQKLVNTKQPVVSNNLLPHHLPHQMASSFITLNIYIYIQIHVYVHKDASVSHIKKKTNDIRKSNTFLQPPSPPARLPALVLLLPGRGKHEDAVEPWDQNPSWEHGKKRAFEVSVQVVVSAILRGVQVGFYWKLFVFEGEEF